MIGRQFRHHSSGRDNRISSARRSDRLARTDNGIPWGVGVPIALVIALTIIVSLWFGWKIDNGLDELFLKQQKFSSETEKNLALVAKRDRLFAKESIVRKAAVLGLFPPTENQIRKP